MRRFHSEVLDSFPFVANFPAVSLVDLELLAASLNYHSEGRRASVVYLLKETEEDAQVTSVSQRALMQRLRERVKAGSLPWMEVRDLDEALEDIKNNLTEAVDAEFPPSTLLWQNAHISVALSSQIGLVNYLGPAYRQAGRDLDVVTGFIDGRAEAYSDLINAVLRQEEEDGYTGGSGSGGGGGNGGLGDGVPQADPGVPALVLAARGEASGHTTLLAHWIWRAELHRERPESLFFFFHFVGLNPHAATLASIAHRLTTELNAFLGLTEIVPFDLPALSRDLPAKLELLHRRGHRGLIIIDGLGLVLEQDAAISWLPSGFPSSVKCILSVGASPELLVTVRERRWLTLTSELLVGELASEFVAESAAAIDCAIAPEDVSLLRRSMEEYPIRANPLYANLILSLLKAANPDSDPSLTRMILNALLGIEDAMSLYTIVLDRLQERSSTWSDSLLPDALSLLRLSVHGLSINELIHMLGVTRTTFSSLFHGFERVLFLHGTEVSEGEDVGRTRLCLRHSLLADLIASRYLADPDNVTRCRRILVSHFGGFVNALKYSSIESVIRSSTDGEFARGSDELCWGLLNNVDRFEITEVLLDISVFRALWSSDLRRDLFRVWQDVGGDENPGARYWDSLMEIYWDSINSDGTMDPITRTVMLSLLQDLGDLCLSLYNEFAYKFYELAIELEESAKLKSAGRPSTSSLSTADQDLALTTRLQGDLHFKIGLFHRTAGMHSEALTNLYRSYTIRDHVLGDHEDTAAALCECGEILLDSGNTQDASTSFLQALHIAKECKIADYSPVVARVLNNLGLMAKKEDPPNLTRAETLYRQSLEVRRATNSMSHPHTAVTLRNLGAVLFALERYREAQKVFEAALSISLKAHGPLHLATASCHEWLGDVLTKRNDPEAAVHYAVAERIHSKLLRLESTVKTLHQ